MSLKFLDILTEEKEKCQYQVRNIGGDTYYKKCGKDKKWSFTDEVDFLKNSKKSNIVKWEEKKPKNQPKVRQLEVPQKKGDKAANAASPLPFSCFVSLYKTSGRAVRLGRLPRRRERPPRIFVTVITTWVQLSA